MSYDKGFMPVICQDSVEVKGKAMDSGNVLMQTRVPLCKIEIFALFFGYFCFAFEFVFEPDIFFHVGCSHDTL